MAAISSLEENIQDKRLEKRVPRWLELAESGELKRRAAAAAALAAECRLCPRACCAQRATGGRGRCGAAAVRKALVARALPHFGEEPPLVGTGGSGTVFFGGCGLRCVFCQNYQISQPSGHDFAAAGVREMTAEELAGSFLDLQRAGCHNLNLVTASSHLPAVLEALEIAAESGFRLPVVYNSGGYESAECLELLDSVVDIYLPDMKFGNSAVAAKLAEGPDYVAVNRRTVKEMFRQAGLLELDQDGLARRGLIVRHLILPDDISGTRDVLEFLAREISPEVHLSLMAQYFPSHKAQKIPELSRRIKESEYEEAQALLEESGLENGWVQMLESSDSYRPDFSSQEPFSP